MVLAAGLGAGLAMNAIGAGLGAIGQRQAAGAQQSALGKARAAQRRAGQELRASGQFARQGVGELANQRNEAFNQLLQQLGPEFNQQRQTNIGAAGEQLDTTRGRLADLIRFRSGATPGSGTAINAQRFHQQRVAPAQLLRRIRLGELSTQPAVAAARGRFSDVGTRLAREAGQINRGDLLRRALTRQRLGSRLGEVQQDLDVAGLEGGLLRSLGGFIRGTGTGVGTAISSRGAGGSDLDGAADPDFREVARSRLRSALTPQVPSSGFRF